MRGSLLGQEVVLGIGHYDLGVNYVPGEGWRTYIYDYASGGLLSVDTTVIRLGNSAVRRVPADPGYALLGDAGATVWVAPEIYDPEIVYLGIGAQLLGRNIFAGGLSNRGQVTMRLVSVTGSGPDAGGTLTMWQSGFPPRFHFSTADGIGPEDALNAITANFHAHYNWAFTRPGLYRVTFEYSGTLVAALGGEFTSTQVTYSFEVGENPEAGALRYAWPLTGGWAWSSWMGHVFVGHAPWVWQIGRGWRYFFPTAPDNVWVWAEDHGWCWTSQSRYPWLWRARDDRWVRD